MAPHQQPRWTPRSEGITWGGFAVGKIRETVRRANQNRPTGQRTVTEGGAALTQIPMTGSGTLSATSTVGDSLRSAWMVTAHATVGSSTAASGRLSLMAGDSGHWPGDPSESRVIAVGAGNETETVSLSHIIFVGGYVNASYTPDSGDVDDAWLVWRAYRLGPV